MRTLMTVVLLLSLAPGVATAQNYVSAEGKVKVALVKMPYSGSRNVPELSNVPDYLAEGGIEAGLRGLGVELKPLSTVALTPEEGREYGEWHRLGLANGHLAEIVAADRRAGYLSVGLLAN
ncbi:MAG: hypothetical protein PVJ64_13510, partial [Gemmatimonadales bacterium]